MSDGFGAGARELEPSSEREKEGYGLKIPRADEKEGAGRAGGASERAV